MALRTDLAGQSLDYVAFHMVQDAPHPSLGRPRHENVPFLSDRTHRRPKQGHPRLVLLRRIHGIRTKQRGKPVGLARSALI